jgi:hypothetical protein
MKQYQPLVFVAVLFFVLYFLRAGLADLPDKIRHLIKKTHPGRSANA